MNKYVLAGIGVLTVVLAVLFTLFPQIDLIVSGWFFDEERRFFLAQNPVLMFLYRFVYGMSATFIVAYTLLLPLTWLKPRWFPKWCMKKHIAYLMLVLVLGPGLAVNGLFKEHWGRARPHQIEEFMKDKTFTAALLPTNQCESNCSFVSGHASMGFYFFAFAFLLAPVWGKKVFVVPVVLGLGLGAARVLQGAHFLSDILFSGIVTFMVCYILYWFMYQRKV